MSSQETEYLNQVIRGIVKFRKCPSCDVDGIELQAYDYNGEPCPSDTVDSHRDDCEDCDGLGFIQIPF